VAAAKGRSSEANRGSTPLAPRQHAAHAAFQPLLQGPALGEPPASGRWSARRGIRPKRTAAARRSRRGGGAQTSRLRVCAPQRRPPQPPCLCERDARSTPTPLQCAPPTLLAPPSNRSSKACLGGAASERSVVSANGRSSEANRGSTPLAPRRGRPDFTVASSRTAAAPPDSVPLCERHLQHSDPAESCSPHTRPGFRKGKGMGYQAAATPRPSRPSSPSCRIPARDHRA
jgi:hypothetical protein